MLLSIILGTIESSPQRVCQFVSKYGAVAVGHMLSTVTKSLLLNAARSSVELKASPDVSSHTN